MVDWVDPEVRVDEEIAPDVCGGGSARTGLPCLQVWLSVPGVDATVVRGLANEIEEKVVWGISMGEGGEDEYVE